ncbi:MAG: GNAT family N-acetyltransferase [Acetobacteraceae bacterium]
MRISVSAVTDFAALGQRWRDLESRAEGSFFQGWTWTGCMAEARFPDPVLLEAEENGRPVALALFNRTRRFGRSDVLFLHESGDRRLDNLTIELNGVLLEAGRGADLEAACLGAVRRTRGRFLFGKRIVASGIGEATLSSLRRAVPAVHVHRSRPAPFVDLHLLQPDGSDYLNHRSANTRHQIRRSDRAYAAAGPVAIERAANVEQGLHFLAEMIPLHQATWTGRGQPGSFADPFFGQFHRGLIARGLPREEIDLLRVTAGGQLVGILYNFRYRRRMLAYQSGLNYRTTETHQKPGLTSHHQAIRFACALGLERYEFLAGDDRYKRSLADAEHWLHWAEAGSAWSLRSLAFRARRVFGA